MSFNSCKHDAIENKVDHIDEYIPSEYVYDSNDERRYRER
jgi:hypothetical protein